MGQVIGDDMTLESSKFYAFYRCVTGDEVVVVFQANGLLEGLPIDGNSRVDR